MTMLDAVKTAIVFAATENDEGYDIVVKTATVTEGSTTVKITADNSTDTSVDISDYVDASDITFKSGASKAEWNGTKWELTP